MIVQLDENGIRQLLKDCLKNDAASQKKLYKYFYSFAMGISLRYAGNRYDAAVILNDGFLKAFLNLRKYDFSKPFQAWLGRIIMNTAVDHYRSNLKFKQAKDLSIVEEFSEEPAIYRSLNYEDLLRMVQQLPVAYRTVFNLFAIDGYSHEEIAAMLHISTGTSKSNLFKARQKLQEMLKKSDEIQQKPEKEVKVIKMQPIEKGEIFVQTDLKS